MQEIKNIIFDLGGVLLDIDYNKTRKAFEALGVVRFDELYSQASASEIFQNLEKGILSPTEFYGAFRELTGLKLADQQIADAWNSMLLDFRETSLQYLGQLQQRYSVYLLSNTNEIHADAFAKIYAQKQRSFPFKDYFSSCIYSFQIGARKPDKECYETVLLKENLDRTQTLFIDDSPQNVEGAEATGMKSILLKEGVLIEDLGLL